MFIKAETNLNGYDVDLKDLQKYNPEKLFFYCDMEAEGHGDIKVLIQYDEYVEYLGWYRIRYPNQQYLQESINELVETIRDTEDQPTRERYLWLIQRTYDEAINVQFNKNLLNDDGTRDEYKNLEEARRTIFNRNDNGISEVQQLLKSVPVLQ